MARRAQAECSFRGGAHAVRMAASGAALQLEVEERRTGHRWRGDFEAAFVEELTRKTGNFKQFGVFCSMLESALTQRSEAVSLELLTYADLEALRSRGRPPARGAGAAALGSKRYLILVYSVEFDRIHYPLPLPYAGRPEEAALREEIRELREELERLRVAPGPEARDAEELRGLQRALRALEAELRSERGARQRAAGKRLQENRRLAGELAEAKAAERSLQLRVKSLSAELARYKSGGSSGSRQRSASRESGGARRERIPRHSPSPSRNPPRFDPTAFVKAKQRRQQEAELRNERRRRPGASWSCSPGSRGRSSSVESGRSRRSAASSGSEADLSEPLRPPACGTPGSGKENRPAEPPAELSEIDARLRALQEYMSSLDTRP
ncbi:centrosomal protein CCDC61 [Eudromia elegans]